MTDRRCETCRRSMRGPADIRAPHPVTGKMSCTECIDFHTIQPNRIDVTATKETQMDNLTLARLDTGKIVPWRRVTAHDGGDGKVVRHCFSCGSGGVVGRSDGSVECTICETVFTVQVQPANPFSPQTVNGEPVHIPGMPEESEVTPATAVAPPEEGTPAAPGTPGAIVPTISDDDMDFMTAEGHRLDAEHYAQYLALGVTPDPDRTLAMVRQANLRRG